MDSSASLLEKLMKRCGSLAQCRDQIQASYEAICRCYAGGGKLMLCGNGGSAADAEHIAGELMKGFMKKRPLDQAMKNSIMAIDPDRGAKISSKLQGGLPAIPLTSAIALSTAVINDNDPMLMYAQQVFALGKKGDIVIGISSSGNAENVICALVTARALGLYTIGLSGETGGKMKRFCDIIVTVPETLPFSVQELHLPIYHTLCLMVEDHFFKE